MGGCRREIPLSTDTSWALRRTIHMLYPELEAQVGDARRALSEATSENIIELCKEYLALLAEYRGELYKLPETPGLNLRSGSHSSPEDLAGLRKAIRVAIENTTQERNETTELLRSFTAVSGYEAVETFNRRKYQGYDNWKLSAGGVSLNDPADGHRITIQEAVNTASLLRREEHVAQSSASEDPK